jgi:hypothetical protein
MSRLRIGVVGFSRPHFDHVAAAILLDDALANLLAHHARDPSGAELVSGLTNMGVPKLAYERAVALGMRTVGVSARQALRVSAGVFPVDETILVGARFGDESAAFIARIDVLIRIGGGPQSRHEVELFRAALAALGLPEAGYLIEHEVAWTGTPGGRRPRRAPRP